MAKELMVGLLIAHVAWLWFWLCGSLAPRPPSAQTTNEDALLDVVVTTVAGFAITALATFFLGLAGAIYPVTALVAVPALLAALHLRGDSPLRARFWTRRWAQLRLALSPGAILVWMLALLLAVPALVPDNGSDATAFYLIQALDYAQCHRLCVDLWLRLPFNPNNWVLIESWMFSLGLARYVQFISALAGGLTLLGVYALTVCGGRAVDGAARTRGLRAIGCVAVVGVVTAPIWIHVANLATIDIATGMMYLSVVATGVLAVRERSARLLPVLILCAGFMVGSKISFVALLPLFAGLCLIVVRAARAGRRTLAIALIGLVAASAPWYVRAFVLDGDPIAPILNITFQGRDGTYSVGDFKGQQADLKTDGSPLALLSLPQKMFADPTSRDVRDWGVSLVGTLYPLALIYVAWIFFQRRRVPTSVVLTAVSVAYAYAYWTLTSHLERYELMFLPVLVAFVGMAAAYISRRAAWHRYTAVLVLLLLAIPPASIWDTYNKIWYYEYANLTTFYSSENDYLEVRSPAYVQIEDVAHLLRRAHRPEMRLYMVLLNGAGYFSRRHGVLQLGDAFGPARFTDLGRAVTRGRLGVFLRRFDVGCVIIPSYAHDDVTFAGLEDELRALGWREVRYPKDPAWVTFTSPQLPPLRVGEGHPAPEARVHARGNRAAA